MPNGEPQVIIQPNFFSFLTRKLTLLVLFLTVLFLAAIFFVSAPLDFYLNLYSRLSPKALSVGEKDVSWEQFRKELGLVSYDKSLKTRKQKLDRAKEKAIELELLRSDFATSSSALSLFEEHRALKSKIEESLINFRTGGYLIVMFVNDRDLATGSASLKKTKAKERIDKLQKRLKKGADLKVLIDEANSNAEIKALNFGSLLAGTYLEKITRDQFPLKIKSFEDAFFSLKEGEISDVLTLSWDEKGEFAYATVKIEKVYSGEFDEYNDWLKDQKSQTQIQSFITIPFFFKWF